MRNVLEELQRQLVGLREEGGEREKGLAGRLVEAGKEVEELRRGLEEQWKRQEPIKIKGNGLKYLKTVSFTMFYPVLRLVFVSCTARRACRMRL